MKLAAIALASTLGGCSMFMHSIEKPQATVKNVSIGSASWTGIRGQLDLDVMNPNNFGVPLSGIDWTMSINGSRAITGHVELSQTIPARGTAPVSTTLTIDARDAMVVAQTLAAGGREYRIDAQLHFSSGFGNVDVAIAQSGTL